MQIILQYKQFYTKNKKWYLFTTHFQVEIWEFMKKYLSVLYDKQYYHGSWPIQESDIDFFKHFKSKPAINASNFSDVHACTLTKTMAPISWEYLKSIKYILAKTFLTDKDML